MDEDNLGFAPPSRPPKRRWMSVEELVTEVEVALLVRERLHAGDGVYVNLLNEAARLRGDNDALMKTAEEKKEIRAKYVAQEEKMKGDFDSRSVQGPALEEVVNVTEKIQQIDYELAGLKRKNLQNIKDIGSLKKALSLIEKRGDVSRLLDSINESLAGDQAVDEDGPEFKTLLGLVHRLRDEFDRVTPKIVAYESEIAALGSKLTTLSAGCKEQPLHEADQTRMALIQELNHSLRMIAQLLRLHDIQRMNAENIGQLERSRAKIERHREIQDLIAGGDKEKMSDMLRVLQGDVTRLRTEIKELEASVISAAEDAQRTQSRLRSLKDAMTAEAGKLREQLIASMHQEEQCKVRLAVLRGQKVQNFKFIAKIKAILLPGFEY